MYKNSKEERYRNYYDKIKLVVSFDKFILLMGSIF